MTPREKNHTKGGSRTQGKTPINLNHQEENHHQHNIEGKRGFDSLEMAPKERSNTKRGSRT
jgi:hypothetical protein